MGIVYHAHYLDYFEAARTEALRALGLSYRDVEASGIVMPVLEASLRYRSPARYDDLLEIVSSFPEVPRARLAVDYVVRRHGEPETLVTGRVVLGFLDGATRRPVRAPDSILAVFRAAKGGASPRS